MADDGMTEPRDRPSGDMDAVIAGARTRAAQMAECSERMRAAAGDGVTACGGVTARVDGYGVPSSLRIRVDADRCDEGELAALILDAFAEAAQDLERQHARILGAAVAWTGRPQSDTPGPGTVI